MCTHSQITFLYSRNDHKSVKQYESKVAQSRPTLCDPMDCNLPGSSVHGILQKRIMEWVSISFSNIVNKSSNGIISDQDDALSWE